MEPGIKVRVVRGFLLGEQGVVNKAGRFPTLGGTKSPPCVMVDFFSKVVEKEVVTVGKLAGDLEIIS
jgi:hypothetical protein